MRFLSFHYFRGLLSKSAPCSALYNDISCFTLSTSASLGGTVSVSKISRSSLENLLLSSSSLFLGLLGGLSNSVLSALHFFHVDYLHYHEVSACQLVVLNNQRSLLIQYHLKGKLLVAWVKDCCNIYNIFHQSISLVPVRQIFADSFLHCFSCSIII